MKKNIYILLTLPVCAAFGYARLWLAFSVVYALFLLKKVEKSALWEIPMGVLACSIILDLTGEQIVSGIRIIIPLAALLAAFFEPEKTVLFFAVSIISIILKNDYGLAAVFSAAWCCGRTFILHRQSILSYSNTKKNFLQGRRHEKYVELPKKM